MRSRASSASRTLVMVSVGPKVSSRTAREVSGTSTRTVGAMKPFSIVPPASVRPPAAVASRRCRSTTSAWAAIVIGPYAAPSSGPGRMLRTFSDTSATKAS